MWTKTVGFILQYNMNLFISHYYYEYAKLQVFYSCAFTLCTRSCIQTPRWITIKFLMIIIILLERSTTFILCPVYCRSLDSLCFFFF